MLLRSAGFAFMLAAFSAAAVFACVGDDPDATTPPVGSDASTVDGNVPADTGGGTNDAAVDSGPACDPSLPFSASEEVAELNGVGFGNSNARLTSDRLTVYFLRVSTNSEFDIYMAKRSSRTGAFDSPAIVGLSRPTTELHSHPFINANASMLFFTRTAGGAAGDRNVYRATATSGGFMTPEPVTGLSTAAVEERAPWLAADGAMWFDTRAVDASADRRIAYATPTGTNTFGPPNPVDLGAQPGAWDSDAVVSPNELRLYFASTRNGNGTATDIYVATRASKAESFGTPTPIVALNTNGDDAPSWISDDDCELWYGSIRGPGFRIFRAFRK